MKRILLIEDEDDIREIAQVSLELTKGWEIHAASSGRVGLRLAAELQPDAILIDVMMPDLDGPATFALLLADPVTASIPVIFLTAKVHGSDRGRFIELGARGLLSKPFDPMKLGDDVAALLGWSHE